MCGMTMGVTMAPGRTVAVAGCPATATLADPAVPGLLDCCGVAPVVALMLPPLMPKSFVGWMIGTGIGTRRMVLMLPPLVPKRFGGAKFKSTARLGSPSLKLGGTILVGTFWATSTTLMTGMVPILTWIVTVASGTARMRSWASSTIALKSDAALPRSQVMAWGTPSTESWANTKLPSIFGLMLSFRNGTGTWTTTV